MTTVELSKYVKKDTDSWFLNYLGHEFQIYETYKGEPGSYWVAVQVYNDSYDSGDDTSGTKEEVRDWICKWFQDIVAESMPFVEVKFIWKENYE